MVAVLAVVRRLGDIRAIPGRVWVLLICASALISMNWGIYVYAVDNGHVVDAALGYFINPLFSVALGVLIFRERVNRAQTVALVIAVAAVLVLAVEVGAPPVIALALAVSFGLYGAVKKVVPVDPRQRRTGSRDRGTLRDRHIAVLQLDRARQLHQSRWWPHRVDDALRRVHRDPAAAVRHRRSAATAGHDGSAAVPHARTPDELGSLVGHDRCRRRGGWASR